MLFRIDSSYLIADAMLEATVVRAGTNNTLTFSLSADKGDTWRDVWTSRALGAQTVSVNIGQAPWRTNEISAVSQYGYLLRVKMRAENPAGIGLNGLEISSDLEINMCTLPRLQPGQNRITLSAAGAAPHDQLHATFCWDDRAGVARGDVHQLSGPRDVYTIRTRARKPDDITMRFLRLENPAPSEGGEAAIAGSRAPGADRGSPASP